MAASISSVEPERVRTSRADVELTVLEERLELLESQRALAAIHRHRFSSLWEATLSQRGARDGASSSSSSFSPSQSQTQKDTVLPQPHRGGHGWVAGSPAPGSGGQCVGSTSSSEDSEWGEEDGEAGWGHLEPMRPGLARGRTSCDWLSSRSCDQPVSASHCSRRSYSGASDELVDLGYAKCSRPLFPVSGSCQRRRSSVDEQQRQGGAGVTSVAGPAEADPQDPRPASSTLLGLPSSRSGSRQSSFASQRDGHGGAAAATPPVRSRSRRPSFEVDREAATYYASSRASLVRTSAHPGLSSLLASASPRRGPLLDRASVPPDSISFVERPAARLHDEEDPGIQKRATTPPKTSSASVRKVVAERGGDGCWQAGVAQRGDALGTDTEQCETSEASDVDIFLRQIPGTPAQGPLARRRRRVSIDVPSAARLLQEQQQQQHVASRARNPLENDTTEAEGAFKCDGAACLAGIPLYSPFQGQGERHESSPIGRRSLTLHDRRSSPQLVAGDFLAAWDGSRALCRRTTRPLLEDPYRGAHSSKVNRTCQA